MNEITWDNSYSVGIKKIDEQHRQLFDYLNKLNESLNSTEKKKSIASEIINDLILYTFYHFREEERIMKQYAYPACEEHKRKHDELTEKVLAYQEKLNSGKKFICILELADFLSEWILNHILEIDKNYSQYLKGKGLS